MHLKIIDFDQGIQRIDSSGQACNFHFAMNFVENNENTIMEKNYYLSWQIHLAQKTTITLLSMKKGF